MSQSWRDMDIPEKRKRVSALIDKGFSAANIAVKLNAPSRNAVIGFCDRQNIKLVGSNVIPLKSGKPRRTKEKVSGEPAEIIVLARKKPKKERMIPIKGALSILDMPMIGCCRGPLNDEYRGVKPSKMMFCGEVTEPDSSWCKKCQAKYTTGKANVKVPKMDEPVKRERSKEAKAFNRWLR